jgi:hypothetical protein
MMVYWTSTGKKRNATASGYAPASIYAETGHVRNPAVSRSTAAVPSRSAPSVGTPKRVTRQRQPASASTIATSSGSVHCLGVPSEKQSKELEPMSVQHQSPSISQLPPSENRVTGKPLHGRARARGKLASGPLSPTSRQSRSPSASPLHLRYMCQSSLQLKHARAWHTQMRAPHPREAVSKRTASRCASLQWTAASLEWPLQTSKVDPRSALQPTGHNAGACASAMLLEDGNSSKIAAATKQFGSCTTRRKHARNVAKGCEDSQEHFQATRVKQRGVDLMQRWPSDDRGCSGSPPVQQIFVEGMCRSVNPPAHSHNRFTSKKADRQGHGLRHSPSYRRSGKGDTIKKHARKLSAGVCLYCVSLMSTEPR